MGLTGVAVVAGVALGLLAGGQLDGLGRVAFRWWPVLAAGVVLQVGAEWVDGDGWPTLAAVLVAYACLLAFALANADRTGMPVALVGLALNAAVITVNGGMPVRPEAVVAAGIADADDVGSLDPGAKRHLEDDDDRLTSLADVIPVRPLGEVVSFGDLILAVGVSDVVFRMIRPLRPARRAPQRLG